MLFLKTINCKLTLNDIMQNCIYNETTNETT